MGEERADDPLAGLVVREGFRARLILLVIDTDPLVQQLADELPEVDVRVVPTAAEGLLMAGGLGVDAVLLATNAHDLPTATVTGLLRRCRLPVVVGVDTAGADAAAAALAAGATASIARPYRSAELMALLRGMSSGHASAAEAQLRCGTLHLDPRSHTVFLRGEYVEMAPQEFRILHFLMAHAGEVVTRLQLWNAVWGAAQPPSSNTISVHIRRIRLRLGDDPKNPAIVTTVGRSGYRLRAPGGSAGVRFPDHGRDVQQQVGA